jgi:hypothetical protein
LSNTYSSMLSIFNECTQKCTRVNRFVSRPVYFEGRDAKEWEKNDTWRR